MATLPSQFRLMSCILFQDTAHGAGRIICRLLILLNVRHLMKLKGKKVSKNLFCLSNQPWRRLQKTHCFIDCFRRRNFLIRFRKHNPTPLGIRNVYEGHSCMYVCLGWEPWSHVCDLGGGSVCDFSTVVKEENPLNLPSLFYYWTQRWKEEFYPLLLPQFLL